MAVRNTTVTHKIDIPHEEGEFMEFRELGWKILEAAREARSRTSMLNIKDLGADFVKQLQSDETPTEEKPKDIYDKSLLLRASIVNWSYDTPCTEANIDELDPQTAEWAFEQILDIHFPSQDEMGKVTEA